MAKVSSNITISPRLMGNYKEVEQINHTVYPAIVEIMAYDKLDYLKFSRERLDSISHRIR